MAELQNHFAESETTVYEFNFPTHISVRMIGEEQVKAALGELKPLTELQLAEFPMVFELKYPLTSSRLDFFVTLSRSIGISGRVRDVIESLEPGVHQFPALIYSPDDPSAPALNGGDLRFYALHCTEWFDFIDLEASRLVKLWPSQYASYQSSGAPIVTKPGWLRSRHLWRSVWPMMSGSYFVSHALKTALVAANLEDIDDTRTPTHNALIQSRKATSLSEAR
jgi:hypothetical protein